MHSLKLPNRQSRDHSNSTMARSVPFDMEDFEASLKKVEAVRSLGVAGVRLGEQR